MFIHLAYAIYKQKKKNSSAFSLADYLVKWPAKWLYFLSERSLTSLHFSYYSGFHFKITVLIQAPWHLFWNSNTKIDRQIIDRQGLADYSIENCVISLILILQFCLFLFAFFFFFGKVMLFSYHYSLPQEAMQFLIIFLVGAEEYRWG